MTEAIYARVRDHRNGREDVPQPPFDENGDPWDAAAWMFDHILKRLDALEERRAVANGRDGVGIVDAVISDGHLVIHFSDGSQKNVGRVVGKDAPPAPPPQSLEFQRDADGRIVRSFLR